MAAWLVFTFRGSYRKKIEFWYDQCSHGQTAFCSYVLSQTALYLQKVICGKKKKTSLVHVRLFSGIGSSAIFEHKNVHTMHFLFVFKLLLKKKVFGDHNLPSCDQKFILDRQLAPVLKRWFRTLQIRVRSDIVNWVEWLWNPSDSFVICFCGPESAQRSKEFLSFWLYWPIKTLH